jgi:hypothetical protein
MMKRAIIVSIACILALPVLGHAITEDESLSLRIDAQTVERGYTAELPNQDIRIGIWPHLLNQPVTVELFPYERELPTPEGLRLVSPIWQFDILKADITYKDPILFSTPLTLGVRHFSDNMFGKKVYYWDRNHQQWFPLPSRRDFISGHIYARFVLPLHK